MLMAKNQNPVNSQPPLHNHKESPQTLTCCPRGAPAALTTVCALLNPSTPVTHSCLVLVREWVFLPWSLLSQKLGFAPGGGEQPNSSCPEPHRPALYHRGNRPGPADTAHSEHIVKRRVHVPVPGENPGSESSRLIGGEERPRQQQKGGTKHHNKEQGLMHKITPLGHQAINLQGFVTEFSSSDFFPFPSPCGFLGLCALLPEIFMLLCLFALLHLNI